jgi:predicted nucleic acid-binding protein
MSPVYFDTPVFLALFKPEKNARTIRELLKELEDSKIRIYTSILSVQEVSVLTFRRGAPARDHFARIAKLARIVNMNKEIALTAAKLEAFIADDAKEKESDRILKQRRKWDCFHIATAQFYACSDLYTTDATMLGRGKQLDIGNMDFSKPEPRTSNLFKASGSGPSLNL